MTLAYAAARSSGFRLRNSRSIGRSPVAQAVSFAIFASAFARRASASVSLPVAAVAAATTLLRYSAACRSGLGAAGASNRPTAQAMPSSMCFWNIGLCQVASLWPKLVENTRPFP